MRAQVVLTGIKSNAGSFTNSTGEAINFDSTTFYLNVDLDAGGKAKTIGNVSRPFKFGDSKEIEKWEKFATKWPESGVLCDVVFGVSAASSDGTKLVIKSIQPATPANQAPKV